MAFFSRKSTFEALKEKAIGRRYESISEELRNNLRNELSAITARFDEEINKDQNRKKAAEELVFILERRVKFEASLRDLYAKFYNDREKILASGVKNSQYQIVKLMQSFDKEHQVAYDQLVVLAQQYRKLADKLKVRVIL